METGGVRHEPGRLVAAGARRLAPGGSSVRGNVSAALRRWRDAAVGIVGALAGARLRLLGLHLHGDAVSISELDQLLEQRWRGKVRRGGALHLSRRAETLLYTRERSKRSNDSSSGFCYSGGHEK